MQPFFYLRQSVIFLILILIVNLSNAGWLESAKEWKEKDVLPVASNLIKKDHLVLLPYGVASILLTATQDDYIRSDMKNNQQIEPEISKVGDLLGTGAGSLIVIGSQWVFDSDESITRSHIRGFVWSGFSIYLLKTLFNRKRPGDSRNYQSFPSGHTTISFMTASQIHQAYGLNYGIPAYLVASFVGATRLADDAHWSSDVVAGALLGLLIGQSTYYDSSKIPTEIESQNNQSKSIFLPSIKTMGDSANVQLTWIKSLN